MALTKDKTKNKRLTKNQTHNQGFTLIELLVVSVVGLLTSILMVSLNNVRAKARDTQRIANIKALQNIIELYYADNGEYPKTFVGANPGPGDGSYYCYGSPDDYIPDVVPKYIAQLPGDPKLDCGGVTHAWTYASNGYDYKLIIHIETTIGDKILIDTAWDDGPNNCVLDGTTVSHYGVWTSGAVCWEI